MARYVCFEAFTRLVSERSKGRRHGHTSSA